MLFIVEDCLIQMRNAPSLRNIKIKTLSEFFCCLTRDGISPSPERHKKLTVFVKRHISVHHSRKAQGLKASYGDAVFIFYILQKITVAVL